MILVLALYALLASTFTLGKMLLFYLPPFLLTAVRMLIAGSLLLGVYYLSASSKKNISIRDTMLLVGMSFIHILIPYSTEFIALQSVAPSCAALMYNLSPFITALFSYVFFNEKMTIQKWIGFTFGFSGIIYFVKPNIVCISQGNFDIAYLYLLISVVSASLGWILVRYLMTHYAMPITLINGVAMFFAGLQALLVSHFVEQVSIINRLSSVPSFFWMLLGLIVFIANILFYNLYGYLLQKYTATFLSFVGFVTPLITALYDWLFLGVPVHVDFYVTIVIVGIGIYLFYKEELRQGYIIQS